METCLSKEIAKKRSCHRLDRTNECMKSELLEIQLDCQSST